ncbi:MAG: ABC transporter permease subunit [Phycisphaerales bacterium]|nr:ABC transporter permease subunit [Phycisphaerales bacterium]
MKIGERIAALDRLQHDRLFKLIATVVVVLAGIASYTTYVVKRAAEPPRVEINEQYFAPQEGEKPAEAAAADSKSPEVKTRVPTLEETQARQAARIINSILARQADPTGVGVLAATATGFAVLIIWLNLAIWYALITVAIAGFYAFGRLVPGFSGTITFGIAALGLWAIFLVLLTAVRILLSGPSRVLAIARNTLDEAARMKISGVFIVLVVLLLAALPLLLDPKQALRYRVQSFLQYGTGLSYMIIAVLCVLFSVYSVSMEQRSKTIWQTVTKPVAAWQYILGKWLGVVSLAAVLLGVTGGAVFLFTEYLRSQPANGESSAYRSADDSVPLTPDREILETQILTARMGVTFSPPQLDPVAVQQSIEARIAQEKLTRPEFGDTAADKAYVRDALLQLVSLEQRTIDPGKDRQYVFEGLSEPRDKGLPIMFRFKPEAGSNRPDLLFTITFLFSNGAVATEKVSLAQQHTITLSPSVIDDKGRIVMNVFNGDFYERTANPNALYFAPLALEMTYEAGSYRLNFARVFVILWLKIAFVTMAGIFAATFLSFPVATLTAAGIFLIAESSRFIQGALENWQVEDYKGNTIWFFVVIDKIAQAVSAPLAFYADLKPTQRLVDGVLLPWDSVATGGLLLVALVMGLFALASYVFRSRELAIYSGN